MKRHASLLVFIAIVASVAYAQQDTETNIRRSAVPKPVLTAFEKMYPQATIKGYARETEKGQTSYEVESIDGKTHRDVSFAPDGKLLLVEESVELASVPTAARQAFDAKYPKARISLVEKVTGEGPEFYEFHFTAAAGKKGEAKFEAGGKARD